MVIQLENIEIYQKGTQILSEVSFEIASGEFVYIIGKTGCGKSSLLKSLYADLKPKGNKISIAGYDLLKLKNKEIPYLRRKLGIIFQDFQLLSDRSVFDNLNYVLKATGWKNEKENKERIHEVLKQVDLHTKDFKLPHQLSGGEQQRLVIARALLNNPEVILADEPTGNLDPDTSLEIVQLLKNISEKGTAVLLATHDYYMIEKFPARLLRVENGKVSDLGFRLV